jgi:hypothetical protein
MPVRTPYEAVTVFWSMESNFSVLWGERMTLCSYSSFVRVPFALCSDGGGNQIFLLTEVCSDPAAGGTEMPPPETEHIVAKDKVKRRYKRPLLYSSLPFDQTIDQEVTFTISTPVQRRKVPISHDNSSMDNFDTLKREATKLERHLEDKVARYQQVCRL